MDTDKGTSERCHFLPALLQSIWLPKEEEYSNWLESDFCISSFHSNFSWKLVFHSCYFSSYIEVYWGICVFLVDKVRSELRTANSKRWWTLGKSTHWEAFPFSHPRIQEAGFCHFSLCVCPQGQTAMWIKELLLAFLFHHSAFPWTILSTLSALPHSLLCVATLPII